MGLYRSTQRSLAYLVTAFAVLSPTAHAVKISGTTDPKTQQGIMATNSLKLSPMAFPGGVVGSAYDQT